MMRPPRLATLAELAAVAGNASSDSLPAAVVAVVAEVAAREPVVGRSGAVYERTTITLADGTLAIVRLALSPAEASGWFGGASPRVIAGDIVLLVGLARDDYGREVAAVADGAHAARGLRLVAPSAMAVAAARPLSRTMSIANAGRSDGTVSPPLAVAESAAPLVHIPLVAVLARKEAGADAAAAPRELAQVLTEPHRRRRNNLNALTALSAWCCDATFVAGVTSRLRDCADVVTRGAWLSPSALPDTAGGGSAVRPSIMSPPVGLAGAGAGAAAIDTLLVAPASTRRSAETPAPCVPLEPAHGTWTSPTDASGGGDGGLVASVAALSAAAQATVAARFVAATGRARAAGATVAAQVDVVCRVKEMPTDDVVGAAYAAVAMMVGLAPMPLLATVVLRDSPAVPIALHLVGSEESIRQLLRDMRVAGVDGGAMVLHGVAVVSGSSMQSHAAARDDAAIMLRTTSRTSVKSAPPGLTTRPVAASLAGWPPTAAVSGAVGSGAQRTVSLPSAVLVRSGDASAAIAGRKRSRLAAAALSTGKHGEGSGGGGSVLDASILAIMRRDLFEPAAGDEPALAPSPPSSEVTGQVWAVLLPCHRRIWACAASLREAAPAAVLEQLGANGWLAAPWAACDAGCHGGGGGSERCDCQPSRLRSLIFHDAAGIAQWHAAALLVQPQLDSAESSRSACIVTLQGEAWAHLLANADPAEIATELDAEPHGDSRPISEIVLALLGKLVAGTGAAISLHDVSPRRLCSCGGCNPAPFPALSSACGGSGSGATAARAPVHVLRGARVAALRRPRLEAAASTFS